MAEPFITLKLPKEMLKRVAEANNVITIPDITFGEANVDDDFHEAYYNMAGPNSNLPNLGSASPSSAGGAPPPSNGNSAGNYTSPLPAGHQQDLNYLYNQIQELSALLKANREKTAELAKVAQEVQRRGLVDGVEGLKNGEENGDGVQTDKQRILELERDQIKKEALIEAYKHEQKENTSLIADYEDALGTVTEQIRNYCLGIESRFLDQRRHYNNLLQQEKDEHLQTRLERDEWHGKTLRCAEMIRTASRLRNDEWYDEYKIIAGLQGEVRCYRRVLGMDRQKPEEEGGYPYLKDLPLKDIEE